MKNIIGYFLGFLLHYANRDIPFTRKDEFYKIKNRILKRYGNLLGIDIQHIRKDCYSCDSTGIFRSEWKQPERCWSCGGTGVYQEFWTRLEKYKVGKWYFHNPIERIYSYYPLFEGESNPLIEGFIHHKTPKYRFGTECALWLFVFFDFKTFWNKLGKSGYPNNKRTPLVFISNLFWIFRNFRFTDLLPKREVIKYEIYDEDDHENLPF